MGRRKVAAGPAGAALVAGAALAVMSVLVVPVGPAVAETRVVVDADDDATRVNEEIVRLRATNGQNAVRVQVRFAELDPARRARVRVLVDPAPKDDTQYIVQSVRRPGEADETSLLRAVGMDFGGTPIDCGGLTGDWDHDRATARLRIPQDCLTENGRVHMFKASTVFGARTGDWTDFLRVRKGSSRTA